MSQTNDGKIPNNLQLGDVLSSHTDSVLPDAQHLFVSLSDLICERIGYHPEIGLQLETLSVSDKAQLSAIVGEDTLSADVIDKHFVETLVKVINSAIQPSHQDIRICLSDTDSHRYSALLGGQIEDQEVNPAIGLRGVARFASNQHTHSFELECRVIKQLREKGLDIDIVVPFVRALSDAATIIDRLAVQGLPRGLNGLKVLFCCDAPASVLLADRLLQYFDGMVVNTNNLTQLTIGADQTSAALGSLFNPEHEAVVILIHQALKSAQQANKPCVVYCQKLAQYPKIRDVLLEHESLQVLAGL
ncbi:putative PEP-binding protein [Vibrio algicola]|uniref:Phosphoenolpyruvate synthase n=1 Tax=Vibrio algicola TaxID=2662262 RepID=A0A5Q0TDU8_9VIBR|nr:putative PEP-binding protein [Vibrio algicola]